MTTLANLDIVSEIRIHHETFVNGLRDCVESALEIGRLLNAQKASMPHGRFLPWLRENVSFISERTAQRWMKLYANRGMLKSDSVSDLTGAYRLLECHDSDDHDQDDDVVVDEDEDQVADETGTIGLGDDHEADDGAENLVVVDDDHDEGEADGGPCENVEVSRRSPKADTVYNDVRKAYLVMQQLYKSLKPIADHKTLRKIRRRESRQLLSVACRDLRWVAGTILQGIGGSLMPGNPSTVSTEMNLLIVEILLMAQGNPASNPGPSPEFLMRAENLRESLTALIDMYQEVEATAV